MGSQFVIWYKRFMILCLAAGIVDLIAVAGAHFVRGDAMTPALTRAVWIGVLVVMISTSSLVKLRQLDRFVKKPD